jgi:sec-independent protein translocase protein TatC
LVVAALSTIGVLSPAFLIRRWRHAVIGIFILTAVITPGDGPSQVVLAAPVLLLYFSSIFVAKAIWRGRESERAKGEEEAPKMHETAGEKPTGEGTNEPKKEES